MAKTFLFFRNSGMPNKLIEDIKLQIHGDLARFAEARTLSLRLRSRGDSAQNETYYEEEENDPSWSHSTRSSERIPSCYEDWQEGPWSYYGEQEWMSWECDWPDSYTYPAEDETNRPFVRNAGQHPDRMVREQGWPPHLVE